MGLWRKNLTSGKRTFFWGIVPLSTLMLGWTTIATTDWILKRALVMGSIDFTFFCFALALYNPKRFHWAMGLAMVAVFLFYCFYVIDEFFFSGHRGLARHRGAANVVNAILGFIFIGLPALAGAIQAFKPAQEEIAPAYSSDPIHPE